MKEVKVTFKGQIVIPKELREELNIHPGEKVMIRKADRKIILIPKPKDPIEFLEEIAKQIKPKMKMEEIRRDIEEFRKD